MSLAGVGGLAEGPERDEGILVRDGVGDDVRVCDEYDAGEGGVQGDPLDEEAGADAVFVFIFDAGDGPAAFECIFEPAQALEPFGAEDPFEMLAPGHLVQSPATEIEWPDGYLAALPFEQLGAEQREQPGAGLAVAAQPPYLDELPQRAAQLKGVGIRPVDVAVQPPQRVLGPAQGNTGWSIKRFVCAARRYRTIHIRAGQHILTAEDPPRPTYATSSHSLNDQAVRIKLIRIGSAKKVRSELTRST